MATKAYKEETFELPDGTEITVRPLVLARLRPFMKEAEKLFMQVAEGEADTDSPETLDVVMELVRQVVDAYGTDAQKKGYEDIVDYETAFRLIEVAGGIKLDADDEKK